jgi:hypothetical protein
MHAHAHTSGASSWKAGGVDVRITLAPVALPGEVPVAEHFAVNHLEHGGVCLKACSHNG